FDEIFNDSIKHNTHTNDKNQILNVHFNEDGELINEFDEVLDDELAAKILSKAMTELFDNSVIKRNSWYLYGSGKKKNNELSFYRTKYIFDSNVEEIDQIPCPDDIVHTLAIRHTKLPIQIKESDEITQLYKTIESKYLKHTIKNNNNTNANNNLFITNTEFETNPETRLTVTSKLNKIMTESAPGYTENIEMARKLIKIIGRQRASIYEAWITVGWALYNTSNTLLPEFIEFSKQDKQKYEAGCCEKIWQDCSSYTHRSGYTIASLYMWAREDNSQAFIEIIRSNVNKLLENADIKTDFDISCVLKEMYRYDYVCSAITGSIWWQFDKHRWRRVDGAYTFQIKMSTEVAKEFSKLSAACMIQSGEETGYKSDILVKKSSDINKLITDLKKTAYKERIVRECSALFYDKLFREKLDENTHILGFDNGVYDLRNRAFRKGCPDDYLSFSTNYDYKSDYTDTHPDVLEVEKFITSVHPQEDIRLYVMCYIASLLEGGNNDQKFIIWIGSGSNGKGTLINLIDYTFGDYFGTLPVTLLTVKRKGTSNATPELADKKGKRALILQEPDPDDKINVGYMKELTGQDKLMARPLYCEPFYFIPQFKMFIACNKLPEIPSDDGGTWRRIRVVEYTQKFVSTPTKPNEHPSDPLLREKLKNWNKPFMWLLINKYYPIYKQQGLDKLEPDCVKLSTKKYKKDSNFYLEFVEENFINSPTEVLYKDDAYRSFKEWYSNNYNERKPPPMKKLVEFFTENGYEVKKGGYIQGITLKDQNSRTLVDLDYNNMKFGL
ncbi:MAG: D5-like helicase-primase, partial [Gaeavirus sp.]